MFVKTEPDEVQELVAKMDGVCWGMKSLVLMNSKGQVKRKKKKSQFATGCDVKYVCD